MITILLTVSIATAITPTDSKKQKGESPLYKIRTKNAIKEKIQNIKTRFLGERIFFIPLMLLKSNNQNFRERLQDKTSDYTCGYTECGDTCNWQPTHCPGPCSTEMLTDNACGCTSGATIFCGICTKGIICRTLYEQC